MNLLNHKANRYTFHLPRREKDMLLAVLEHYPSVPARHQPLTKSGADRKSAPDARLLEEALADHRRENERQLKDLLLNGRCLKKAHSGWHLVLTADEVEWLLQVLNDVRVGSWIVLGAPEKDLWDFELNENTAPAAWAMEIAGLFQAVLLESLEEDSTM